MAMKLTRKAVPQTRVGRRKADINICRIQTCVRDSYERSSPAFTRTFYLQSDAIEKYDH